MIHPANHLRGTTVPKLFVLECEKCDDFQMTLEDMGRLKPSNFVRFSSKFYPNGLADQDVFFKTDPGVTV